MAPSGTAGSNHGERAISRHLKVLLPSSSSNKLRISDELAGHFDGDAGAGGTALVVSPFGKVWRVEVGRDGDGAFLGRGWPEFVAAHRIGAGWFLVFRNEGGGVLTVKAFDTSCCLREFSCALNIASNQSSTGGGSSRRPQFIKVLLCGFMEKMLIPPKFVQNHITEAGTNCQTAVLLSPYCKFVCVNVDKDERSGSVSFTGGWSHFLVSHGITQGDALLLRYEGNMVFTVKAFRLDGCQKNFKSQKDFRGQELEQSNQMKFAEIKTEQDDPSSSSRKCKSMHEKPNDEAKKRPRSHATSTNKERSSPNLSLYRVGPRSWMKREIKAYVLSNHLTLAPTFCKAIGFVRTCEITLRTVMDDGGGGVRSWQVVGMVYKNGSYRLTQGWTRFCQENGLREGDVCTFNVVETTLWHVNIGRRSTAKL